MTRVAAGVAVIVPALNPGPFLRDALASLLAQTYPHWEAVVVDDGSTEDLSWVAELDPRVRLVRQPNRGLAGARNRGLDETTQPWIALLDSDDVWAPEKLARQVCLAGTAPVDVVSTFFHIIDAHGAVVREGYHSTASTYHDLLRGNGICASTVLVRRAALDRVGRFDATLRRVEDWDAWLRLAAGGARFAHLEQPLAGYRVHGLNMSGRYAASWSTSVRVLGRQLRRSLIRGEVDACWPVVQGARRMGELYGAQAYDAFRERRRPMDLGWALLLSPGLTVRQALRKMLDTVVT